MVNKHPNHYLNLVPGPGNPRTFLHNPLATFRLILVARVHVETSKSRVLVEVTIIIRESKCPTGGARGGGSAGPVNGEARTRSLSADAQ